MSSVNSDAPATAMVEYRHGRNGIWTVLDQEQRDDYDLEALGNLTDKVCCGIGIAAVPQLPKLVTGVRLPYPALP